MLPQAYRSETARARIMLIAQSHARLLGRPLVDRVDDVVEALWLSPLAIVAHDSQADPVFFFGNHAALAAFAYDADAFLRLPSRLSAEAPLREERQALLDRVSARGFIDDYAGIRISATGRRFRIENAAVWNLVDAFGQRHGQAAAFAV